MIHVRAKAPTRVDLAGGTLDLWPIHHLLDRKATVNVGVTLDAHVEIIASKDQTYRFVSQDQNASYTGNWEGACGSRELPLFGMLLGALWRPEWPALTITTAAKSPAGAGLGGSSCLGVALGAALDRARRLIEPGSVLGEADLIRVVQDVEARLIRAPTGVQDYWGGMRGCVNVLTFPFGRVDVETMPAERLAGLVEELVLCYSGRSRASAINNWEIFKRLFDGDRDLLAVFQDIGAAAEQCGVAARDGDLPRTLFHSAREWELRTRLWPAIETAETKRMDSAARSAGARFSRVCGAGGGGVMAVFAPPSRREAVEAALTQAGGAVLRATVAPRGLEVEAV
jgi:D-glycero-alpha-D-manno-heptose-7-phosphate kinase